MTDILAIYGAILSTVLAVPVVFDFIRKIVSPIRFICISQTGYLLQKNKDPLTKYFFDITLVNRTKEILYLNNCEVELKYKKDKGLFSHSPFFVKNSFENKLEPSTAAHEYGICTVNHKSLEDKANVKYFDKFRFVVEDSHGKKIKSKWYKQKMLINFKDAIWERPANIEEFRKQMI